MFTFLASTGSQARFKQSSTEHLQAMNSASSLPTTNLFGMKRTTMSFEDRVTNGLKIRDLLPQLRKKEFDLVHIHAFGIAFHEGVRLARMLKIPAI